MKGKIIKAVTLVMAFLTLTVSSTVNTFAWDIGDMGMEDGTTILPNTTDQHRTATFNIDLPTGNGTGFIRMQNHYFDPYDQIGYPTSMTVSMGTNVICDFCATLTGVDNSGVKHYIEKSSAQSYGLYGHAETRTPSSFWRDCYGDMWVCDDVDYGIFGSVEITD